MRFITRLQDIDVRILYLLLALVMAVPLIWPVDLPIHIGPEVKGAYQAVEDMPSDTIALLSMQWGSGTMAENRPQAEAVMRHLFMLDKKFAVIAFSEQGSIFAQESAEAIAAEFGKEYGVDWIHWGFKPPANMIPLILSFPADVIGTMVADREGVPLGQFPIMENVRTIKDIGLIMDVTSVGLLDVWIGYIYGPHRTPLIYGPTAVMAPEGYNPLDAGQIRGMLNGMQGAAAYEVLLDHRGRARRGMAPLSASHLLIIVMIILGNIGYIASRRRRER